MTTTTERLTRVLTVHPIDAAELDEIRRSGRYTGGSASVPCPDVT